MAKRVTTTQQIAYAIGGLIAGQDAEVEQDPSVLDGLHEPVEGLGHGMLCPAAKVEYLRPGLIRVTLPDGAYCTGGTWELTIVQVSRD